MICSKLLDIAFLTFLIFGYIIADLSDIYWKKIYKYANFIRNIVMAFIKIETSTPSFEFVFWLVQNIRSIHDMELFITCVGLSII